MRKAQGLSLNFVIVGIIALVVLVVIILIFTGGFGNFRRGTSQTAYNSYKVDCEKTAEGKWIFNNTKTIDCKNDIRAPAIPIVEVPKDHPDQSRGKFATCCVTR
ncbi:MAG TPA: hypothetical protein ENN46_04040 [Candidatus Woesearchaeota archaeon]|nr:hypothetical protein [Candidatus Woesearchaeota archaeon]